jgi:hypothetical protein
LSGVWLVDVDGRVGHVDRSNKEYTEKCGVLQSDCVKLVDEKSTISSIPHIYMHHMGRFYQSQLLYSSQQRVHGSVNKVVFAICFTRGFNLKCGLHVSDTIVKPAMHAEACGNYSSDTSVEAMWSGLNPRVDGLIFPVCQ